MHAVISISVLSAVLGAAPTTPPAGSPVREWKRAGPIEVVSLDPSGKVSVQARSETTAGAVSPAITLPAQCDALLIEAEVSEMDARALTFAAHLEKGEAIAYWQNPVPLGDGMTVSAVLPFARKPAGPVELFAGTHRQPSFAAFKNLCWTPLRRNVSYHNTAWGVLVDDEHRAGQTFRATGRTLAAIVLRIRELNPGPRPGAAPGLRVQLYAWKEHVAASRSQKPLADVIVPRSQIPEADAMGARDLPVAFAARTEPGSTYLLDLSAAGPCPKENAILLFGGEDAYAGGCRYENETAWPQGDVYLETYDALEIK